MQPYLFAYMGHFQMIKAVDKFVFYDDVNYIKQGWINRNRILVNGEDFLFTIPLQKANSFEQIKNTLINPSLYSKWNSKFKQTINQNYKKAPYFKVVNELISSILDKKHKSISDLAIESTIVIANYLKLNTKFQIASEAYDNQKLERLERLLDICKKENADQYINAIGGQELYKKEDFLSEDIDLQFIHSLPIEYTQFDNEFVTGLSIIDVLMFNSVEEVNEMLDKFELV